MINLTKGSKPSNTQHPAYKMLSFGSILDQLVDTESHGGNHVCVGLCDHAPKVIEGISFTTKTKNNGSQWASGYKTEVAVFADGEYITRY